MSYTVEILRRAEKALRDLTDRKLYHRLRETIDVLANEPRPHETIDVLANEPRPHGCTKLSGTRNLYRVRIGDHRIVYQVIDDRLLVLVVDIGHRREIYRA
jgi:mRNA interferase RelE/StbE